jgi:HEAT repeats
MRPASRRRVSLRLISLVIAISLFAAAQPSHAQSGSVDVAKLLRDMKDQDPAVRGAATQTLTDLRDPRYLPNLIRAWKESGADVKVRKQLVATTALGTTGDTRAIPALIEAMVAADPGKDPIFLAEQMHGGSRETQRSPRDQTASGNGTKKCVGTERRSRGFACDGRLAVAISPPRVIVKRLRILC